MSFLGPRTSVQFWEPQFYEWQRLWRALCNQYGREVATAKFYQTDPETQADLQAWRTLGGLK